MVGYFACLISLYLSRCNIGGCLYVWLHWRIAVFKMDLDMLLKWCEWDIYNMCRPIIPLNRHNRLSITNPGPARSNALCKCYNCHESWALAALRCEMLPHVVLLLSVLLLLRSPLLSRLFRQSQRRLEGPHVLGNLADEVPNDLLRGVLDLDDVKDTVKMLPTKDTTLNLFHPLVDFVAHTMVGVDGFAARESRLQTAHHHNVV